MNWRRLLPGYRAGWRDAVATIQHHGVHVHGLTPWPPSRRRRGKRRA